MAEKNIRYGVIPIDWKYNQGSNLLMDSFGLSYHVGHSSQGYIWVIKNKNHIEVMLSSIGYSSDSAAKESANIHFETIIRCMVTAKQTINDSDPTAKSISEYYSDELDSVFQDIDELKLKLKSAHSAEDYEAHHSAQIGLIKAESKKSAYEDFVSELNSLE